MKSISELCLDFEAARLRLHAAIVEKLPPGTKVIYMPTGAEVTVSNHCLDDHRISVVPAVDRWSLNKGYSIVPVADLKIAKERK